MGKGRATIASLGAQSAQDGLGNTPEDRFGACIKAIYIKQTGSGDIINKVKTKMSRDKGVSVWVFHLIYLLRLNFYCRSPLDYLYPYCILGFMSLFAKLDKL